MGGQNIWRAIQEEREHGISREESLLKLRNALERPEVRHLLSKREVVTDTCTAEAGVYREAVRFYSRLTYRPPGDLAR